MSVLMVFFLSVCIALGLGFLLLFYLARPSTGLPTSWNHINFEIKLVLLLIKSVLEDFYLRKRNQVGEQSSEILNELDLHSSIDVS